MHGHAKVRGTILPPRVQGRVESIIQELVAIESRQSSLSVPQSCSGLESEIRRGGAAATRRTVLTYAYNYVAESDRFIESGGV